MRLLPWLCLGVLSSGLAEVCLGLFRCLLRTAVCGIPAVSFVHWLWLRCSRIILWYGLRLYYLRPRHRLLYRLRDCLLYRLLWRL